MTNLTIRDDSKTKPVNFSKNVHEYIKHKFSSDVFFSVTKPTSIKMTVSATFHNNKTKYRYTTSVAVI